MAIFMPGGIGMTAKEYKSFITINFQKASDEVKNLFVNGLMDLDLFFITLEKVYKKKLYPHALCIRMVK